MTTMTEFSIVLESYNLTEGTSWERLRDGLRAAEAAAKADGGEVLITDVYDTPELITFLNTEFPQVQRIVAKGLSYDAAKMKAAEVAQGEFVLFLDGDCLPVPGWHLHMLKALREQPDRFGVGGFTRYDGGYWSAILSIMDFGFLYPALPRKLECYASNNSGFRRAALLEFPMFTRDIRCSCFYHAQCLLQRQTPMWLVPESRVTHELPLLVRERTRQGYDSVAACWINPSLPEARWLPLGVFAVPLFYLLRVWLDWKRVWWAREPLKLSLIQVLLALPMFPLLRLLDSAGMAKALIGGIEPHGWGGWSLDTAH